MLALCLLTYIGPLESASPFQLLFLLRSVFTATDDSAFSLLAFLSFTHVFSPVCSFSPPLFWKVSSSIYKIMNPQKHLQDGISSYCLSRLIDQHFKLVNLCIEFRCDLFSLLWILRRRFLKNYIDSTGKGFLTFFTLSFVVLHILCAFRCFVRAAVDFF